MAQTTAKSIALADFLHLPETRPASEYIDGQIIQKPMSQGQHSLIQQTLTSAINAITEDAQVALALPELRCTFGNRSIVPNIAVFLWERLPTNENGLLANTFGTHPDWTIQILSPEQSSTRVASNVLHCLNHGCHLGWLIDPNERLVQVYERDNRITSLESATDVLPVPDFAAPLQLTLGNLFDWLRISASNSRYGTGDSSSE